MWCGANPKPGAITAQPERALPKAQASAASRRAARTFALSRPYELSLSAKVQSLLRKVTPRRNKQEQNRTAPRARHRPRSAQRRQGDDDCPRARTRWREQTGARCMVSVRKQSTISAVTSKHSRGFRHSRQISYRVLSPVVQSSDSSNASPQNRSRILYLCVREHRLYTQIYADVLRRCVPVQPGTQTFVRIQC